MASLRSSTLKREGRDWREKRDWYGQGSHGTRVSLLSLVARRFDVALAAERVERFFESLANAGENRRIA